MYVLKCIDLFIKRGGFTKDLAEAKRYATRKDARRDQVGGWVIVNVLLLENSRKPAESTQSDT